MTRATPALVLLLTLAACAPSDTLTVSHAWVRAPAPGFAVAAGYLDIHNGGSTSVALTGASSSAAGSIEIHSETHDGDMMQMRQIDSVPIASGQTASFAPGGTHLMLLQFSGSGPRVPITLTFSDGTHRDVEFELRALDGGQP